MGNDGGVIKRNRETDTVSDIATRINASGKFIVDTNKRIIYEKVGCGWFMYSKFWSKKDLEQFEAKKCQH